MPFLGHKYHQNHSNRVISICRESVTEANYAVICKKKAVFSLVRTETPSESSAKLVYFNFKIDGLQLVLSRYTTDCFADAGYAGD